MNNQLFCKGCDNADNLPIDDNEMCVKCNKQQKNIVAYDQYYTTSIKTVMVPVEVRYNDPTDIMTAFTSPTFEQVETAFTNDKSDEVETALRKLLDYVVSGRRYNTTNPYFVEEVKASFKALGLNHLGKKDCLK